MERGVGAGVQGYFLVLCACCDVEFGDEGFEQGQCSFLLLNECKLAPPAILPGTVKPTNNPKPLINPKHIEQPNKLQNLLHLLHQRQEILIASKATLDSFHDHCLVLDYELEF